MTYFLLVLTVFVFVLILARTTDSRSLAVCSADSRVLISCSAVFSLRSCSCKIFSTHLLTKTKLKLPTMVNQQNFWRVI